LGPRGTRKKGMSRSVYMGSVTLTAIAGVSDRPTLAEPLPGVGS